MKKLNIVIGLLLASPVFADQVELNKIGQASNAAAIAINTEELREIQKILPVVPEVVDQDMYITLCPEKDYPQWGKCLYKIGGKGPSGGLVFHITEGGLHGIESSLVDLPKSEWGCYGIPFAGAGSSKVGDGQKNTTAILEAGCQGKYTDSKEIAARIADSLEIKGFNDWYLPSEDELGLMYTNLKVQGLGNFVTYGSYRSSTDGGSGIYSRERGFSSGQKFGLGRNSEAHVRPVRSF